MLKNYFGKTFPALLSFKSCYSFTFLFVLFTSLAFGQTTLISPTVNNGGFENNLTGWTTAQNNTDNKGSWYDGTATTYAGTRSAYISNNTGTTNTYTGDAGRVQHLYRQVTFPAGETIINLSFYWKCQGESVSNDYDNLKVFVSDTEPTAGNQKPQADRVGATWYNDKGTTWQNASITLPAALAGTTKYLIFQWKQDASTANQPPAAIDNITLTTQGSTNFTCATAKSLPCGTTSLAGTTVGTTSVAHGTGCSMSNYGAWYTFIGDGQQTTISSTAASGFDHEMSISYGSCDEKTSVICKDGVVSGATETHTFTPVNGTRYYVYIGHYTDGSTSTGSFTISRTCTAAPTAPANDLCANATNLPCGTTSLAGTTLNTTSIANTSGCANMSNYGVWYTFLGDGQQTTITTNPSFDIKLSVSTGTCGSLANIVCTDTTPETATFTTVNGTRYYVYIASYGSSSTTTGTFTISRSCAAAAVSQNVPTTGNNTVTCGTNVFLYDNGGVSGDYAYNSNGYTVLQAGSGATINILGNYNTENNYDYIRIYNGTGTGGTLLNTYSGSGTINYTGTAGQTLTVQFTSDSLSNYSGFTLSVSYSGVCFPACADTPTGGTVTTNPNTAWPGSPYTVSATGYTQALNMTYQWQYSTDAGATWTNAGAATGTYSNYNATAPASGDVLWHLLVTCTNSSQSATSSNGTFVTMAVSNVETGCPNVVSGGLGLNGADPAIITCLSASGCVDLEATYLDLGNTTSYIVEPIAYNPPRAFNGLANPVSVNTDDVWSPLVTLPFDFCFYGNTYRDCLIGSNGVITFDTTNNSPEGSCEWDISYAQSANLPATSHNALIKNSIFGVFHDIDPELGGIIGWELITLPTGCRALVASWYNVPMFSSSCSSQLYTGMMVLYENSNIIEVYTQTKSVCSTWNEGNAVIGIQNADGTLASVPPGRNVLDPNWTATNEAWRFVPNGTSIASIKWYEGSGVSGTVVGTTDVISVCPTNTTIYTAEITYTLCDGRTITELDETTVTVNKDKTWNGSTSTDWNVASNWTPSGVPTAAQSVNIPNVTNDPIVGAGADALACSLSIENGGVLTINSGRNIIVTNAVTVAVGGTFNVKNSASLIQVNNVVNSGIMNMERTANIRKLDYVYWSSPVTLPSSFSSGAISPLSPTNLIFKWTPTIASNVYGFGNWTLAVENMAVGKGYIVRGPNSFTNTAAPFTATFIGTPNNGTITAPIQRGTYDGVNYNTGVSTSQGTKVDDNWNLLGNPYPSAINAISFLTANTNIDGQVKIWTHGNLPNAATIDPFYNDYVYNYTVNDYITYNSSGPSTGPETYNGYIPAGQGFFVSMKHTSASTNETVLFNNSMRSSTYTNSQFFRTAEENSATNEEGRIWLDIVNANGLNVRTLVAYVEGATNERDRLFDAFTDNKTDLNLYSNVENEHMIIQGRRLPFEQNDQVPMGIKVAQDGTYTITIAAVEGLFSNASQTIYIEDTQTNIIHNLRQSPYSFAATTGNHANRFVLRYTNETLGTNDLLLDEASVWVFSDHSLTVKSSKNEIQSVRVFDLLGRALAYYPNVNSMEVPLTTIQKNDTGLIIQVTLSNGTIVTKKTIY